MEINELSCVCRSPVNIALVKYWGKKDEHRNIPLNPSLSITLELDGLYTKTRVDLLTTRRKNSSIFILDGNIQKILPDSAISRVLAEAKAMGLKHPLRIESTNSFPTNAGLASSASAFSALALCIGKLCSFNDQQIQILARIGSGSACRSLFGGFVEWVPGSLLDGSDSLSYQIYNHNHWPELRVLVIVFSNGCKSVPSRAAMARSVASSELLRLKTNEKLSDKRIEILKEAIKARDFEAFAQIVMKESHTFHAVCEDTYPPIEPPYLSLGSHRNGSLYQIVEDYNVKFPCKRYSDLNMEPDAVNVFKAMYISKVGQGPLFSEV